MGVLHLHSVDVRSTHICSNGWRKSEFEDKLSTSVYLEFGQITYLLSALHAGYDRLSEKNLKFDNILLIITGAISRTTESILGLFVLILM